MELDLLKIINDDSYREDFLNTELNNNVNYVEASNNLYDIDEDYEWEPPRCTLIPKTDGGKREIFIYSYQDRLAQKMLASELAKEFDSQLPKCTYAYRKGISRLHAVSSLLRKTNNHYSCKIDIKNYFRAVEYIHINNCTQSLDISQGTKQVILNLYKNNSYLFKDKLVTDECIGLAAGSPLSAFFANHLIKDIDIILEKRCKGYARYCDDMIIMEPSKEELEASIDILTKELSKYGLEVKETKTEYYEPGDKIEFLGLEIENDIIDISKKMFSRRKRRVKSICKKYRKLISLKEVTRDEGLQLAINAIVKDLYKQNPYKPGQEYTTLTTMFSNINTLKTIRELDFYIINTLQWVYTGKHNKMNPMYIPKERLFQMGYISLTELFTDYKVERDIYTYKVSTI